MTEAGPAPTEIKQRITRSSTGHASVTTGSIAADTIKQEDTNIADRAISPNSRSTRSRTSTPTQDTPDLFSNEGSAKRKMGIAATPQQTTRRVLRSNKMNTDEESDRFCWICRKDGGVISCQLCPRIFHLKCLGFTQSPNEDWICIECEKVMRSECEDTRPKSMSHITMDQLILCLQYALERMKIPNSEVFQVPVDPAMEPEYHNIIVHPMDMSQLDKNIKKKQYGSTEAFLADAKWILHNSIIYNGMHNKYTMTAKAILKVCRNQMTDIETCADCFLASCTQETDWFCKPCKLIHPLVWAKLKGYPFWPAKALREVEAWVAVGQVFMLSEEPPAAVKNKKGSGFDEAIVELEKYVVNFKAKYGAFNYADAKEPYNPNYGQSISQSISQSTPETKKRKLQSPNGSDEVPNKKLAEDEKSIKFESKPNIDDVLTSESQKPEITAAKSSPVHQKASVSQETQASQDTPTSQKTPVPQETPASQGTPPSQDIPVSQGTPASQGIPASQDTVALQDTSVSEELEKKPVKPGVFTISDTVLDPLLKVDYQVSSDGVAAAVSVTESSVFKKIEEKLGASGEPSHEVSGKTETSTPEKDEEDSKKDRNICSQVTQANNTQENNAQTSTSVKVNAENASQDDKEPANENVSEVAPPTAAADTAAAAATSSREEESKETENEQLSSKEYKEKLNKTIDECKSKLGVSEACESNSSEDSEYESDSDSDGYVYVRKRKKSNKSGSVSRSVSSLDNLKDSEKVIADEILTRLKEGLESTIRDTVRNALLGKHTNSADLSIAVSNVQSVPEVAQSNSSTSVENKSQWHEPMEEPMEVSAANKRESHIPRTEPLSETNTNQENKTAADDPGISNESMTNETVEKLQWKHKCEIEAVKHTAELATMEMRKSIELEKERALWRLRKQLEHKYKRIIEETKKKQWCAMCGKEAIFYCCWNTSYCDYPCQQKHWPSHLKTCAQIQKDDSDKKNASQTNQQPSHTPNAPVNDRHSQSPNPSAAPPSYQAATASSASSDVPTYQVQYMPVHTNASHVYQTQVPIQTLAMQSSIRSQTPSSSTSLQLYPVMQPPSSGPPPPQGFMVQQRHPYRLAPKYN